MSAPCQPSRHSASGSALVLTLLITALLATIAVSFLSTSRIEMMAARNFSRQTAASGLAELATQQAMAKIQLGFTVNGTGTTVITTQPGAIWQFTFSSGTCNAVASKIPVELFTTNGTINANLNNLQNPSSNSSATTNQTTITGNRSQRINVPMENITSNGTLIGRIAYYVDDEGTKLNLNAATDNRTTLNVASSRVLSLSALNISANWTLDKFRNITEGNYTGTSNVNSWAYFFRPEQAASSGNATTGGLNLSSDLALLTTATTSASSTANMTHLLTPWGTQRIAINMLSTNATDGNGTASVSSIFEALTGLNATSVNGTYTASNSTYGLTGQGLQNIFGGNFSTKYTPAGVKQIAANMLQMRDPNTFSVNASFGYNGSILCDALGPDPDPYDASQYYYGIPGNYLANTPFPVINEIGCTAKYSFLTVGGLKCLRLRLYYWIELFNPYELPYTNITDARLVFMLDKIQFQTDNTGSSIIGVGNDYRQYQNARMDNPRWGFYTAVIDGVATPALRTEATYSIPSIPARSTKTVFMEAVTQWFGTESNASTITGNITTRFERILLLANGSDPRSIRDAISGNDTGDFVFSPVLANAISNQVNSAPIPVMTFKRLDARNKTTRNGTATGAFIIDANVSITTNGSSYQDNIAPTPDSTSGYDIPGDPILSNNSTYLLSSNSTADKLPPVLDFPAFSSPADLGKVPTNTLYRSLRMQMQPANEGTRIPDWAMLDVISFGNSTDPNLPYNRFQPVNIHGKFYLPGNVTNSSPPTPRTMGLRALAKVVEISANATLRNPIDLTQSANLSATNDVTRFKGAAANATTIANAIGNMTWSANSTWDTRRNTLRFPADQYILPSEIMEIDDVADEVSQTEYNNSSSHFKRNEGRASALIPAVTTRSSFFTIYAYAQAGRENPTTNQFEVDSEALTKTLVEVEITTPATATSPAQYKVKKLYTQNLPMGN